MTGGARGVDNHLQGGGQSLNWLFGDANMMEESSVRVGNAVNGGGHSLNYACGDADAMTNSARSVCDPAERERLRSHHGAERRQAHRERLQVRMNRHRKPSKRKALGRRLWPETARRFLQ
jgi:hypothetical protein